MRIVVNGETREVPTETTVRALLVELGLGDVIVAVERNGTIVPRATHGSTPLAADDHLEVVHFVGGG